MNTATNVISRLFGKFAAREFSPRIQRTINRLYVRLFNIDMSEFAPADSYKSLSALFTRELKSPRSIAPSPYIAPCDCLVTLSGKTSDGLYQIKGVEYSLPELLSGIDSGVQSALAKGFWANLYLSPRDYHRYHSPTALKIEKLVYIPAALYPVNSPALRFVKNLYIKNERVIIQAKTASGAAFVMVLVGALNVGQMVVNFEPRLATNAGRAAQTFTYSGLELAKGEEFGYFKMGSTILLFSQDYEFSPRAGEKLSFGSGI
ncbi:MAG: phosphatidylserine decarboxylase [Helicobacteraceae bacterium]